MPNDDNSVYIYRFTTGGATFRRDRGCVRSIFAPLHLQNSCCLPSKRPSKACCTDKECPEDEEQQTRLPLCQKRLPPLTAGQELSVAHPDSHDGASLILIVMNAQTKAISKMTCFCQLRKHPKKHQDIEQKITLFLAI